ncbi:MAG: hypothetical protein V7K21_04300 [Nostoc sp.]|uniref:hypothetical protein n=1 Tax=Nostoc sp. TaxID=1180 RepID=UPI002FF7E3E3
MKIAIKQNGIERPIQCPKNPEQKINYLGKKKCHIPKHSKDQITRYSKNHKSVEQYIGGKFNCTL